MIAEIQKALTLEDHLELRIARLESENKELVKENRRLIQENISIKACLFN